MKKNSEFLSINKKNNNDVLEKTLNKKSILSDLKSKYIYLYLLI